MIPSIELADRYCALTPYELNAGCDDALIGNWIVTASIPANESGVIFSSPFNPVTTVTVPAEGTYFFQFECCK